MPKLSDDSNNNNTVSNSRKYDELDQPEPQFEPDFSGVIIIDGLPAAAGPKAKQLEAVLRKKVLEPIGEIYEFHLGDGFAFVEFANEAVAKEAINRTNGKNLDKNHRLRVTRYTEFQRVEDIPDAFVPPKIEPYVEKDNLKSWLLDPRGYDQFALRYADATEIAWNDLKGGKDPERVVKREGWSSLNVFWSPKGTYFTTFDSMGVYIHGGPEFTQIMRYPHKGVRFLDISPCERYLVTGVPSEQYEEKAHDILIWDIRTGRKLRGFPWSLDSKANFNDWPVFKWTRDGDYVCRAGNEAISIYETPAMILLDKEAIKVPHLSVGERGEPHFSISPKDPYIAYFVKAVGEKPAAVTLINFKTKQVIAQKNLFNVQEPRMFWQSEGDYLLVRVEQTHQKQKNRILGTALEIFRIREPQIPVEQYVMKDQKVKYITWEPKGHRLALLAVTTSPARPNVIFISVVQKDKKKNVIQPIKTLNTKPANSLFWSPKGSHIVLAGLHATDVPLGGTIEFYNVADLESMGVREHVGAGSVEWDPSGRYVTSVASIWRGQSETGYNIYSFNGKHLVHVYKEKFCQFLWRPRPATLLSKSQQSEIVKNEKKYRDIIRKTQLEERDIEREQVRKRREKMKIDFLDLLSHKRKFHAQQKQEKEKILKPLEWIEAEQVIEHIVSRTDTVLDE